MDFNELCLPLFQLGNADLYNSYLQSLKRSVAGRRLEVFWELLVQGLQSSAAQSHGSSPIFPPRGLGLR